MQILDRTSRHIVVELSTKEAGEVGEWLYRYYGSTNRFEQMIPAWLVDFGKALIEYGCTDKKG